MKKEQMNVIVAGKSGDGATRTVGDVLRPVLSKLNLLAHQTYVNPLSVIMSPDVVTSTFPIGKKPWISAGDEEYDLLISLEDDSYKTNPAHPKNPMWDVKPNRASIATLGEKVIPGGAILYDSSKNQVAIENFITDFSERKIHVFPIPATSIARDLGLVQAKNIVMVGALLGLMDLKEGPQILKEIFSKKFGTKGQAVVDKNMLALEKGYNKINDLLKQENFPLEYKIKPPSKSFRKQFISVTGNQAFCLGAIAAGSRFMACYPISPASPQEAYLSTAMPKYGGVIHQASSEIAAIHEAIGASAAGVRSYVATSGPGLSLKIEGISHAAMMEVPIVICDVQRKGPDTGAPTKTEQADLNLAKVGSHSDIPIIVLAPSDHEDCFWQSIEAFNLADIYQCPVIVLLDQSLAEGGRLLPTFDFSKVKIDRGKLLNPNDLEKNGLFLSYKITADGISPWTKLGNPNAIIKKIGSFHTEGGHVIAYPEHISKMHEKLMQKMDTYLKDHFPKPQIFGTPEDSDIILAGWGSTKEVLRDTADRLTKKGINSSLVHFNHVWPLDKEKVRQFFPKNLPVAVVEGNISGQFAAILESILYQDVLRINNYSGKQFEPGKVVAEIEMLFQKGEGQ